MKLIHPAFMVRPSVPEELSSGASEIVKRFIANTELAFPGQFLFSIPGASVRGSSFVVLPEGAFVVEGNWRSANVIYHPHFRKRRLKNRRTLKGNWYPVLSYYSQSYHHWLWNDVPRLMTALPNLPPDTRFLIPQDPCDYHTASLDALGISRDRLEPQEAFDDTIMETMWFASPLGDSEWAATDPQVAGRLREKLWEAARIAPSGAKRKFYVSRAHSQQRRIVNEDQILPIIQRYGFETVFAERLSFMEQVSLFSQAKIILGAHGAGLTNMLHAEPGATILEIHVNNTDMARTHYWTMAHTLGHGYACMVGEEVKNEGRSFDSDISIRPQELERMLAGHAAGN